VSAADQLAMLDEVLSAVEICMATLRKQDVELDVDVARTLNACVGQPLCELREALAPAAETST